MKADPKKERSAIWFAARIMVAAVLTLSMSLTIVADGLKARAVVMDCCVGHEPGSCSSGLMHSSPQPEPAAEASCHSPSLVVADDHDSGSKQHRSLSDLTVAGAMGMPATHTNTETTASGSREQRGASVHVVSNSCPSNCDGCANGYVRCPRPFESSATALKPTQPHVWKTVHSRGKSQHLKDLDSKWSQLQPRAPPRSNS